METGEIDITYLETAQSGTCLLYMSADSSPWTPPPVVFRYRCCFVLAVGALLSVRLLSLLLLTPVAPTPWLSIALLVISLVPVDDWRASRYCCTCFLCMPDPSRTLHSKALIESVHF